MFESLNKVLAEINWKVDESWKTEVSEVFTITFIWEFPGKGGIFLKV